MFFHNPSVEEMHRALGMAGKAVIVRDHANGCSFTMEFSQQLHYGFAVFGVEVTCRFIGEQYGRLARQRPSHGYALLLATGELGGIVFASMRHPHFLQGRIDLLFPFRRGHPAIGQRQFDILKHGEVADEIEALKDEADFAISYAGAVRMVEAGDRLAIERVVAVARRIEQAEDRQQGGLAAARRAGYGHEFAAAYDQVDFSEGMGFHFIGEKHFCDLFEFDQGLLIKLGLVGSAFHRDSAPYLSLTSS